MKINDINIVVVMFHTRTTSMLKKLYWDNFNVVVLFQLFHLERFCYHYVHKETRSKLFQLYFTLYRLQRR